VADEVVEYLVEKFSAAEIESARATVFAAHLANFTDAVVITSSTFEGGTATGTINVSPQMREHFLRQCRTALSRLNSEATTMSAGLTMNWAARRLET
jgi:hypothetical protein